MMLKSAIGIGVAALLTSNLLADFPEAFQAAMKLYGKKKNKAAYEAFLKLAEDKTTPYIKGKCLKYAAISLGRQKKYDQAIELAKKIQIKPLSVNSQMEIMLENRKYKELIEAFKDENIAAWPDEINYKGFSQRAKAYNALKNRQAALKDFEQSVAWSGSDIKEKLAALNNAASLYHALGNDGKAIKNYEKAFAIYDENPNLKGCHLFPKTLMGASLVFKDKGEYDKALDILDKFKHREKRNTSDCLILEACGDIYSAQRKNGKALEKYQEAAAVKTYDFYIERINKKIEDLKRQKQGKAK